MNRRRKASCALKALQLCYLTYKYIQFRRKRRRWWVRPVYQGRKKYGFFEKTFKQIKESDNELFFKLTRMNKKQYDLLLSLIKPYLTKTSIRSAIDPECRLVVTILYLSQGVSRNYLAWSFRMGVSTVRKIIIEVCEVLWNILSPFYMSTLNTVDWETIANDFQNKWQMPNCIGSIDGKHVKIKCPPKSGSQFFNYKKDFSIVLLGVCDANYVFTVVDVGAYGSQSDGGIFRHSEFGRKVFNHDLNAPPPRIIPDSSIILPMYFVADSAFPLRTNIMRPYPGLLLERKKEIFNRRLSRARRMIENTFGILSSRWRVLLNVIEFHPDKADKVVLACVILHNFLKITDEVYNNRTYSPPNYCDSYDEDDNLILGLWRDESSELESVQHMGSNNSSREAIAIRNTLAEYFVSQTK